MGILSIQTVFGRVDSKPQPFEREFDSSFAQPRFLNIIWIDFFSILQIVLAHASFIWRNLKRKIPSYSSYESTSLEYFIYTGILLRE